MNPTPPAHSANQLHSLVHWLNLAGVSVEVGNLPAIYKTETPSIFEEEPAPVAKAAAPQTAPQVAIQVNQFKSLDELNNFCVSWKDIGLAKTASRAVLGLGKTQPRLMVIADIPDDTEDRSGQAFSSSTSLMIRQALNAAGIPADAVYFTYLSKWRTPAKRNLAPAERDICAQILNQEIGFVQPEAILALGESVYKVILGDSAPSATKLPVKNDYTNQYHNKNITVLASQKAEVLVKNPLMKKSFWFGLIDLARASRT